LKKLAIIRTHSSALDLRAYNIQEIGLAKELIKYGISVDVYSRYTDIKEAVLFSSFKNNFLKLIPISGISILNKITYFPGLIKSILIEKYDLVQVHEDSQLMTPIILYICKKNKIATVLYQGLYTYHNGIFSLFQKIFDFLFSNSIKKNSKHIFAKTEMAKKYLENKGYKNIDIMPIGLDQIKEKTNSIYEKSVSDFTKKFEKILLYVGALKVGRNPFFLVDLLEKIRKIKNFGMVVVGNGPLLYKMIHYSKDKNVFNYILFINKVPNNEIGALYKLCDLFLLPTTNEIYGMVILEALYYGLPIISTPEAGPSSILVEKRLGILVGLDKQKWTDNIYDYLYNYNLDDHMIFRKKFIVENYTWEKIVKKYYNKIIDGD